MSCLMSNNVSSCNICNLVDLPESICSDWNLGGKRKGRSRSKSNTDEEKFNTEWISCDCCKNWFHPYCCGLKSEEFKKLSNRVNKNKSSGSGKPQVFFKCTLCCLKFFNQQENIDSFKKNVWEKVNLVVKGSDTSEKVKVEESIGKVDKLLIDKNGKEKEGKFEIQVVERKKADIDEYKYENSQNIEFEDTKVLKSPNNSGGIDKIELRLEEDSEIREKIVIVDNIENPSNYRNSKNILKEVKQFSKLKVEFAYPLVKGGVAIHTKNKEDRYILLEHLAGKAFGSCKISKLSRIRNKFVFIKKVDVKVSIEEISSKLESLNIPIIECKRIINSRTQRPTKTIKVTINNKDLENLLRTEISIGGEICIIEKQKIKYIVRCYECQQFGHIGQNCHAEKRCVICAGNHKSDFSCSLSIKCSNCQGKHSAADIKCPVFIKKYEDFAK